MANSQTLVDASTNPLQLGVRRISTGSLLASAAYGALIEASLELRDEGTATTMARLHATHARVRTGHS